MNNTSGIQTFLNHKCTNNFVPGHLLDSEDFDVRFDIDYEFDLEYRIWILLFNIKHTKSKQSFIIFS